MVNVTNMSARMVTPETPANYLNLTTSQVVPLGIFCFFMTFFGILGNGTVLYSSIRYNSIRLDKISLIFVKNLAAADILYTIFAIFPNFITFSARKWVLGAGWCFISAQLSFIPGLANIFLVLSITLYRVVLVVSPFDITRSITARIIAGSFWLAAIIFTLVVGVIFKVKSVFNPDNGTCMSSLYDDPRAKEVNAIFMTLSVVLPMVFITLGNVILCVVAFRHSNSSMFSCAPTRRRRHPADVDKRIRRRNKGLVMTCLLSGMFVASWLPFIIYNSIKTRTKSVSQVLDILSFHCIFINTFGNPILYSLTNKRFGKYVKGMVLAFVHCDRKYGNRRTVFKGLVRARSSVRDRAV